MCFFLKTYLFMWLCQVFTVAYGMFSFCCGTRAGLLQHVNSWLRHVGPSSLTRDQTRSPHWEHRGSAPRPTREVPVFLSFLYVYNFKCLLILLLLYCYFCLHWAFVALHGRSLAATSTSLCCGAQASHRGGFSCCGAEALGEQASAAAVRGSVGQRAGSGARAQ